MTEQFEWFVAEREDIRSRREYQEPPPYTDDPRLRDYHFPNIRRADDPTTVWFRAMVLRHITDPIRALLATTTFRVFNNVAAGELIRDSLLSDGYDRTEVLCKLGPLAGSAFNRKIPIGFGPKSIGRAVAVLDGFSARSDLHVQVQGRSLERAWEALCGAPGVGPALAYEIICDLRHASLQDATDIMTWAAPTKAAAEGASSVTLKELSATRRQDRRVTVQLMHELLRDDWEMSEAHRALCLFHTWAQRLKPPRRYRWK